jgi:hypothetical protein
MGEHAETTKNEPVQTEAPIRKETALDVLLSCVDPEARERILRIVNEEHLVANDRMFELLSIVKVTDDATSARLEDAAGKLTDVVIEIKDSGAAIKKYRTGITRLRDDLESASAEAAAYYESIKDLKSHACQLVQAEIKKVAYRSLLIGGAIVFVIELVARLVFR